MRLPDRSMRLWLLVLPGMVLSGTLPQPSLSQGRRTDRSAYLQSMDLQREAQALEQTLLEALQADEPAMPPARRESIAEFFAFVMTLSGLTAEKARRLQAAGVDIAHAITAGARPLMEQALLSDLVVVGRVARLEETPDPGDGFRSSLWIRILRTLKGVAPGDTVVVRQRGGLSAEAPGSRDLIPAVGETYLLLLSNGMYRFFVATREEGAAAPGPLPGSPLARHCVIFRWYRMDGGRLLWDDYTPAQTERALQEVQWLDELMKSL